MPRNLTGAMKSAVSARGTRPGYFIEVSGAVTHRWTTRSTVTWNGHTWVGTPVTVSGIGSEGGGPSVPMLSVVDQSGAMYASALNGDLKDAEVRIWAMDGAALAAADPVLVFTGAVTSLRGDVRSMTLEITLAVAKASALYCPRMFYGPQIGISTLMPKGTILVIGDREYTVERR